MTESIFVVPSFILFDGKGSSGSVNLSVRGNWRADCPEWISLSTVSGAGDGTKIQIRATAGANPSDDERSGAIYFATDGGKSVAVAVSQPSATQHTEDPPSGDTPEQDPPTGLCKSFVVCANSMVYYGGLVKGTGFSSDDRGMFYKMMKAGGHEVTVYNCTKGAHYLRDFLPEGCQLSDKGCYHQDHMSGVPFDKIDCIILSEAGSNTSDFLSSVRGICKRVTDKNPGARKIYINHVYSVYKKHSRILGSLKTLHDQDGFTIINCGQLAYDIYTGAVKVPGGSLSYSDRYTFCNHTSSDTYHPNPLMGYIMTQMLYCAITGESAEYADYSSLIKGCAFSSGSVSYSSYYNKYYTTPPSTSFMSVIDNPQEMKGIQKLIPQYINKF